MALGLRYAARSDVGMVREGNEDSGYAGSWLLAVADGMGGHAAGELASAMAIATFAEVADAPLTGEEALGRLGDAVDLTSERIADVIAREPQFQGMGTTFTGLVWMSNRLALVHIGDSRAYRYRQGELTQLTKDHTYVQTLVDSGQITPEEAARHPRRNLIMRAIDGVHDVDPDLSIRDLQLGDRYLLCTDGLSGVVDDATLQRQLASGEPTGVVTRLVDLALEAGAPDNVTVVVADVVEVQDEHALWEAMPVVVGAAGESRNRKQLPNVPWPVDEQPDPEGHAAAARAEPDQRTDDEAEPEVASRPLWRQPIALVVAGAVASLALITAGLLFWLSQQWYVGESDGKVAIYQGVPSGLGPISLNRLKVSSEVPVASLPTLDQERVTQTIWQPSFDAAFGTVAGLDQRAQECAGENPPLGCPEQAATEVVP